VGKNILFISPQPYFQLRGSPIRVNHDVQALSKLGYKVDLLTLPIGEDIEIDGVNLIRIPNPLRIRHINIGPSISKLFFDFFLLIKALKLVSVKNYQVIHGVEDGGVIAAIVNWKYGIRCIYEKHSDLASHKNGLVTRMLLLAFKIVEKWTIRRADAIICTGKGLTSQVKMIKNHRVYNIVDLPASFYQPSRDEIIRKRQILNLTNDEVLVTFVGSFAVYQGIDLLMETAKLTLQKSSRIRFLIIGGKPDEIDKCRQYFMNSPLAARIHFNGVINPEKVQISLSASDILLSTRLNGVNSPLKLIDYLKAGKPIVATDTSANRAVLDDGQAVFANPQVEDFSAAIISLVNDEKMRYNLGKRSLALYNEKYGPDCFICALEACYNTVIDNN
jgi:glycosyltransferase involved in cell wall biosynthesis